MIEYNLYINPAIRCLALIEPAVNGKHEYQIAFLDTTIIDSFKIIAAMEEILIDRNVTIAKPKFPHYFLSVNIVVSHSLTLSSWCQKV